MGLQILSDTVGQKYTSVMVPSPQPLDNTAVFVDSDHNVELYPRPNNVLYACGCPERLSVADLETKFSCADAILPEEDNVDLIKKEVEKNSFLLSSPSGGGDSPNKTTGTTTPAGGCSSPQVEATACVLPSSMDGGIVLGQIEATDNAFVGCGHTCWGILNGPGSGYVLAKLVLDEMGMKGVGGEQSEGVAGYYSRETYKNPHEDRVREVFQTCWRQHFADGLRTSGTPSFTFLDMCAGSGEVTAAFLQLAEVAGDSRTFACDPYTFRLFEQRFAEDNAAGAGGGKTSSMRAKNKAEVSAAAAAAGRSPPTRVCWPLSFGDILQGRLLERMQEHRVDNFDLITCSYALHLAPDEQLPVLAMLLSQLSRWILIITPHKRPVLREDWGWEKMDEIVIARTRGVLRFSIAQALVQRIPSHGSVVGKRVSLAAAASTRRVIAFFSSPATDEDFGFAEGESEWSGVLRFLWWYSKPVLLPLFVFCIWVCIKSWQFTGEGCYYNTEMVATVLRTEHAEKWSLCGSLRTKKSCQEAEGSGCSWSERGGFCDIGELAELKQFEFLLPRLSHYAVSDALSRALISFATVAWATYRVLLSLWGVRSQLAYTALVVATELARVIVVYRRAHYGAEMLLRTVAPLLWCSLGIVVIRPRRVPLELMAKAVLFSMSYVVWTLGGSLFVPRVLRPVQVWMRETDAGALQRGVMELLLVTLFLSVYTPLGAQKVGKYLIRMALVAIEFNQGATLSPADKFEVEKYFRLMLDRCPLDIFRYAFGRGVLLNVSPVTLTIIVMKDVAYDVLHFGMGFHPHWRCFLMKLDQSRGVKASEVELPLLFRLFARVIRFNSIINRNELVIGISFHSYNAALSLFLLTDAISFFGIFFGVHLNKSFCLQPRSVMVGRLKAIIVQGGLHRFFWWNFALLLYFAYMATSVAWNPYDLANVRTQTGVYELTLDHIRAACIAQLGPSGDPIKK
eukprot:g1354.t1